MMVTRNCHLERLPGTEHQLLERSKNRGAPAFQGLLGGLLGVIVLAIVGSNVAFGWVQKPLLV